MKRRLSAIAALALVASLAVACGKDAAFRERLVDPKRPDDTHTDLPDDDLNPGCPASHLMRWSFVQPQPEILRSVDLLFVVDSSTSLSPERARLAATIPAFLDALDSEADYRIAVMQGHGGNSSHSGRIYSAPGQPKVLDPRRMTVAQIQDSLTQTLSRRVSDADEAGGEALLYSLNRSLEHSRLTQMQAHGFYREEAALAVIFINDENDLCFPPQLNGYTSVPDYKPSPGDYELRGYCRHCLNSDGSVAITPEGTLAALRRLKGERPISFGAITHVSGAHVSPSLETEDSIGHGILELLDLSLHSVKMEVGGADYAPGLAQLGNVVSTQLRLKTSFALAGSEAAAPESIVAAVDGKVVQSLFETSTGTLQVRAEDAGTAGSRVDVVACRR